MGFVTTTPTSILAQGLLLVRQQSSIIQHGAIITSTTQRSMSPLDFTEHLPAAVSSLWDHHHMAAAAAAHHVASSSHSSGIVDDSVSTLLANGATAVQDSANAIIQSVQNVMDAADEALTVEMEEMSLEALGHDCLLFLAASVLVDPLGKILGVSPVLLYLVLGFVAGPYGLSLFDSSPEITSEIGDFGILFLLFVEGLNLSPERLKALGSFFSLGATQLLLSVGLIFFGLFFGGPYLLPLVQADGIPIDPNLIQLVEKPVIAFSIASAGALSSSAFVLPILKEKGWEKSADGIAALSILLLQDLAVAPLLVILPLFADFESSGGMASAQDPTALGVLIGKATIGFGGVLAIASLVFRRIFQVVAKFGSAQTFIAASLLVAAGMGIIADDLGLSSTTGAFAAGVLLAESGYRAQIEADIKPFEGILLGVFFVTAGASLDPQTVIEQWPTLVAGISAFITVKFFIVLAAGNFALGLTKADAVRVAFLLAGGGEFAFVVFKLASNLDILTEDLVKLLTASVVISMSLTPFLGELASWAGTRIQEQELSSTMSTSEDIEDYDVNLSDDKMIREAFEKFDEDGSGTICAPELQQILTKPGTADSQLSLEEVESIISRFDENNDGELAFDEFSALWTAKRRSTFQEMKSNASQDGSGNILPTNAVVVCGYGEVAQQLCATMNVPYVAFSRNPARISQGVLNGATVVYGNGAAPTLIRSAGVEDPSAIVVAYATESRCLEATLRLHRAFPRAPVYVRTSRLAGVDELMQAGATKVVVETRKTAEAFGKLVGLEGAIKDRMLQVVSDLFAGEVHELPYSESELTELAYSCDLNPEELGRLYELFATSLNKNEKGEVQLAELRDELMRRRTTPLDDDTLKAWMGYEEFLSKWVTGEAEVKWVSFPEFVRFAAGKL